MKPTKAMEPRQDSERRTAYANLDTRYGRIGISAVAAAVRCKGEIRKNEKNENKPGAILAANYESD